MCLILCGLWGVVVWALFGGAICRTAAVQLAADEQVGWGAALRFAWRKWPAYSAAPLMPVGGVLLAAICVAVLGLFMHWLGLWLGGILWPLVVLAGFIMAMLLLGGLFGWPLMWGAISAEGTDSFDALSRSYAYTFQRPLHYLFYAVVAAVIGWLGWLLVQNFASAVIWLSYWAAGWGCGKEQLNAIIHGSQQLSAVGKIGAGLITFWVGCVKLLAVGYLFSYFWTASAAIYFLLRRDVDATEMDEVFLDADQSEPAGELPPVTTDQAGRRWRPAKQRSSCRRTPRHKGRRRSGGRERGQAPSPQSVSAKIVDRGDGASPLSRLPKELRDRRVEGRRVLQRRKVAGGGNLDELRVGDCLGHAAHLGRRRGNVLGADQDQRRAADFLKRGGHVGALGHAAKGGGHALGRRGHHRPPHRLDQFRAVPAGRLAQHAGEHRIDQRRGPSRSTRSAIAYRPATASGGSAAARVSQRIKPRSRAGYFRQN